MTSVDVSNKNIQFYKTDSRRNFSSGLLCKVSFYPKEFFLQMIRSSTEKLRNISKTMFILKYF